MHRPTNRMLRTVPVVLGLVALAILVAPAPTAAATTPFSWQGTLTAISGTTIPATLTLQVNTTTYTVNVTSATSLVRKYNGLSSLEEFGIGDTLKVWGTLTNTTIDATRVKNYSIQRVGGEFWGTILSIDTGAKSFVIKPTKRSQQTVTTTANTTIFQGNRKGEFGDLAVGQSVKVIGLWRKSQSIVVADRVLIKLTELNGTITSIDCAAKTLGVTQTGKASKLWTVALTDKTVIRDKNFNVISCADMKVNDRVQVRGLRTGTASLNALLVRDKGVLKVVKVLNGEITSIDSTAKTFVLAVKGVHGTSQGKKTTSTVKYTVTTTAETIIVGADGMVKTFTDLAVDHDAQVRGSVTGTAVTANLIIDKDL